MNTFKIKTLLILALFLSLSKVVPAQNENIKNNLGWWSDARFGMFIHWGLYAQEGCFYKGKDGKTAHMMRHLQIPLADYAKIADEFNPVKFDAKQWVKVAKDAGMKYMVYTAKHHDGFAMFHSPSSGYDIVSRTPFKRDPIKELALACRETGMRFGVYYSLGRDWQDPDAYTKDGRRSNTWDYPNENSKDFSKYFERKVKPQIRELLTQYGAIDIVWFDTPESISPSQSKELVELIHSLQPNCIINSRVGNKLGDYAVSEQEIPESNDVKPWETCMTHNKEWGFKKNDYNWKSAKVIVQNLIDITSKGGNFLFNVGPTGEGLIPQQSVDTLKKCGKWLETNGESIYGTLAGPIQKQTWGRTTMKTSNGKTFLYLHIFDWPTNGEIAIPLKNKAKKAYLLNSKKKLKVKSNGDSIKLLLPNSTSEEIATVVVVELVGNPILDKSKKQKSEEVKDLDKFY